MGLFLMDCLPTEAQEGNGPIKSNGWFRWMFPGPQKPERGYKNGTTDPKNRNEGAMPLEIIT